MVNSDLFGSERLYFRDADCYQRPCNPPLFLTSEVCRSPPRTPSSTREDDVHKQRLGLGSAGPSTERRLGVTDSLDLRQRSEVRPRIEIDLRLRLTYAMELAVQRLRAERSRTTPRRGGMPKVRGYANEGF